MKGRDSSLSEVIVTMDKQDTYKVLVDRLVAHFGQRLKLIVLFGSQSRAEAKPDSDHDIFVLIEDLPVDPLARQREVTAPLLPVLLDLPERLSIIAKTPQELSGVTPPLVIDVCMDGQALYGETFFAGLQAKVRQSLHHTGLQRRCLAGTWMWTYPTLPGKAQETDWEDYREPA
jgi:predicted nucleotidyltransferase